jgi:putative membrane protein
MRKLLPVVIATLLIACKKDNDNPNEVNSTDKNFLIQTYLAAKGEIQAGQLALNKSGNGMVQSFGQRIIADYKAAQTDLIAVANKLNFSLTDTTMIGNRSISYFDELSGYSFDTAYLQSRMQSQLELLRKFQIELNNGNNTYVRYYFLNKYIDKVRAYYQEADSISRAL